MLSDCQLLRKRVYRKKTTDASVCVTVLKRNVFVAVCTSIQGRVKFCCNRYFASSVCSTTLQSHIVCAFLAVSSSSTEPPLPVYLFLCLSFFFAATLSLRCPRGEWPPKPRWRQSELVVAAFPSKLLDLPRTTTVLANITLFCDMCPVPVSFFVRKRFEMKFNPSKYAVHLHGICIFSS